MIVFPIGLLALHIPSPQSVEGSWRLLAFSFWWHTLEKKMGPYFNFIGSFWDPFSTVTSFPTPPSYITPFSDSGALLSFVPIFDDFSFFSLEIEIGSLSLCCEPLISNPYPNSLSSDFEEISSSRNEITRPTRNTRNLLLPFFEITFIKKLTFSNKCSSFSIWLPISNKLKSLRTKKKTFQDLHVQTYVQTTCAVRQERRETTTTTTTTTKSASVEETSICCRSKRSALSSTYDVVASSFVVSSSSFTVSILDLQFSTVFLQFSR